MLAIVLVMFLVLLLAGFPIIVSMGIPALLYVIVEGLPISTMAYSAFQALNELLPPSGQSIVCANGMPYQRVRRDYTAI